MNEFGWVNWLTIFLYLGALAGIGVYFSRRQKNLEDFFLAGRSMGWLPVGMSLMAALNSGLDYMTQPFLVFEYGLIFLVGITSWLFLYPWVSRVTMPFYRRLNVFSAYEYLEARFNSSVRTLAAAIFLLWRVGWMSVAIYAPSLAISTLTNVPLLPTIVALGAAVTLYTMLGGITAIIWTDVLQFCIMLAGVLATILAITYSVDGGLAGICSYTYEHGKTALVAAPAAGTGFRDQVIYWLTSPMSIFGIVIATVVGRLTTYTCEQSTIQRFQSTKSLTDSRQAFIVNALGDAGWTAGLMFVGLALFTYYHGQVPLGEGGIPVQKDQIVIHFMKTQFPILSGLVVAAVLASGLSATDAAINAGTSVIMVDFYNRFRRRPTNPARSAPALGKTDGGLPYATPDRDERAEQRHQIRMSRIFTVVFALVGITLAANVSRLGANLLEIGHRVIQTPTGPLLGIFLLGMFSRRVTSAGALAGGVFGLSTALFVAFGTEIGFLWPTVFGVTATVIPGYLISLAMSGAPTDAQLQLTWRAVMRRPLRESGPADVAPA